MTFFGVARRLRRYHEDHFPGKPPTVDFAPLISLKGFLKLGRQARVLFETQLERVLFDTHLIRGMSDDDGK